MNRRANRGRWEMVVAVIAVGAAAAACGPDAGPPPGRPYRQPSGRHPVVAAAGDIACPDRPCDPDQATAELVSRIDPDLVLVLGDTQYTEGTPAEYASSYDRTWGAFKDRTRPVPGNHEYRVPNAHGYFGYFGSAAAVADGGDYSFDIGRWHVVAMNSAVPGAVTDDQLEWVRDDLEASSRRCEIAYWHHPRFSSGAVEGSDPVPRLEALWSLLYDEGVDIVLNGHAHQYERFEPLDDDGVIDEATGLREFVVGTGGATPHPFEEEPSAGSRVRLTGVHGVLELVLRPRGYRWRFVTIDGTVLDHGAGRCHGEHHPDDA